MTAQGSFPQHRCAMWVGVLVGVTVQLQQAAQTLTARATTSDSDTEPETRQPNSGAPRRL